MTDNTAEDAAMEIDRAYSLSRALRSGGAIVACQPVGLLLVALVLVISGGSDFAGGGSLVHTRTIRGHWAAWKPLLRQMGDAPVEEPLYWVAIAGGLVLAVFLLLVCGGPILVVRSWLKVNYYRVHREALVTGQAETGMLFEGHAKWLPVAIYNLLTLLILGAAAALCFLPFVGVSAGLVVYSPRPWPLIGSLSMAWFLGHHAVQAYIRLGLWHGEYAIVFLDHSPREALRFSWSFARGRRFRFLLFYYVLAGINFVGMLCCFVGLIPAGLLTDAAATDAFLHATRDDWEDFGLSRADSAEAAEAAG